MIKLHRKFGIFDENKTYKAIPIVVGGNHLLPAIEEAIIGLDQGDKPSKWILKTAFGLETHH